jgi:hypothetical protein
MCHDRGKGEEMIQTLYAHMNKRNKKKMCHDQVAPKKARLI